MLSNPPLKCYFYDDMQHSEGWSEEMKYSNEKKIKISKRNCLLALWEPKAVNYYGIKKQIIQ